MGPKGSYSEAILVTNVTDGDVGTGPGDVPPPGSIFNFRYFNGPSGGPSTRPFPRNPAISSVSKSLRLSGPFPFPRDTTPSEVSKTSTFLSLHRPLARSNFDTVSDQIG